MDLKIDNTGDLVVENGDLVIVDGVDAIAQHITIRLKFFLGEYFLDVRIGLPYYQQIFVKNPDLDVVKSIFREVILTTQGVQTINELSLEFDAVARLLSVAFQAMTIEGPLVYNSEFIL